MASNRGALFLVLLCTVSVRTQLPSFFQNSYSFTINQCNQGTSIGTVPVVSPGSYTYSVSNPSVSVSPSGQLTLANSINSGFSFVVTVTNSAGSNSAVVVLTANCGSNGFSNGAPFASGCPSGYYYSAGACISYYGGGYNNYNYGSSCPSGYLYISGTCIYQGYGYNTGNVYCTNGVCSTYNNGLVCNGNFCYYPGVSTTTAYTFSTSTCAFGIVVGSVTDSTASSYTLSGANGYFYVSNSGQIIMTSSSVPSGTYTMTVTINRSTGNSSITVTVVVNCNSG